MDANVCSGGGSGSISGRQRTCSGTQTPQRAKLDGIDHESLHAGRRRPVEVHHLESVVATTSVGLRRRNVVVAGVTSRSDGSESHTPDRAAATDALIAKGTQNRVKLLAARQIV
jgi:hypothetical protein